MLLKHLLKTESEQDVSGIGYGKICKPGYLYFCLKRERREADLNFAEENGAVAVVCDTELQSNLPVFYVKNIRKEFALSSSVFYGNPSASLTMIGVSGTNGKTTTTHIIRDIMVADGRKCGLIGTNYVMIGDKVIDSTLTTPDPPVLHSLLSQMKEEGVDTVIMEVSAHALALEKISGIRFAVSVFTNLSQDHLDFFGDMDNYARAKKRLFTPEYSRSAVINVDDPVGIEIVDSARMPVVTYGLENPSDAFGIEYSADKFGCSFVANIMDDILEVDYCAPGKFNMSNVLASATVAKVLGVDSDVISYGVRNSKVVSGRFQIVRGKDKIVIVDYAHTPDGLKKVISTAREITKGKVITVFGCGGDRDKTKRAIMGEVASELSDFIVVTSDNPRSENPDDIAKSIVSGCKKNNYKIITDRKESISYALNLCGTDDTVIVAGKGHEKAQESLGVKTEFSDVDTVKELLGD